MARVPNGYICKVARYERPVVCVDVENAPNNAGSDANIGWKSKVSESLWVDVVVL